MITDLHLSENFLGDVYPSLSFFVENYDCDYLRLCLIRSFSRYESYRTEILAEAADNDKMVGSYLQQKYEYVSNASQYIQDWHTWKLHVHRNIHGALNSTEIMQSLKCIPGIPVWTTANHVDRIKDSNLKNAPVLYTMDTLSENLFISWSIIILDFYRDHECIRVGPQQAHMIAMMELLKYNSELLPDYLIFTLYVCFWTQGHYLELWSR